MGGVDDEVLLRHAKEILETAIGIDRLEYMDPITMVRGPYQTYEWVGQCMEAGCIAQQLYAEKMGWTK
jgi:hypothetical protein